ncbi:MAG: DUF711 family protein [Christensenellales bacterium]
MTKKNAARLPTAKLVVFANAVEDNPFMAGAFHGAGRRRLRRINVGVSGPGVVKRALETSAKGQPFDVSGGDDQAHGASRLRARVS